jgi:hypothetical protein
MRSSSNRSAGVCDAILVQDERAMGPMRLPDNRADDFIDHFNRTYEDLGMTLAPITPEPITPEPITPEPKKIPGSLEATGDDDLG